MKFFTAILTGASLLLGITLVLHAQGLKNPISLTFVIDVSVSQEPAISRTRKTTREFIATILNSSDDKAAVVTFAGEPSVKQQLTGDLKQIDSALKGIKLETPPGYIGGGVVVGNAPLTKRAAALGRTAIWDAIWFTCDNVFVQPAKERRQAIILFTDGLDTNSQRKIEGAIERAVEAHIVVYVVGTGERDVVKRQEQRLQMVSEKTGGQAFFPRSEEEMRDALRQIEQRLRG